MKQIAAEKDELRIQVCSNCHNRYTGKLCNKCGEKAFHPRDLSAKHFLDQTLHFFTHFESKVLKTIRLLFTKPGFVTKENLEGRTVGFAKPVQLFIVVNLIFYLTVSFLNIKDYTPTAGDAHSSKMSDRWYMRWARPVDQFIIQKMDTLKKHTFLQYDYSRYENSGSYQVNRQNQQSPLSLAAEKELLFYVEYDQRVTIYSKVLIFILIPVFAIIFYLLFNKKLRYFGSALILATHFLAFNLLFYTIFELINYLPLKLDLPEFAYLPSKAIRVVLYNEITAPLSSFVFGIYNGFEAMHVLAWGLWLFFAFKTIFKLHWLLNIFASYLLARLFFFIIFSFYKKFLIAFTFWNM